MNSIARALAAGMQETLEVQWMLRQILAAETLDEGDYWFDVLMEMNLCWVALWD